MAKKKTSANKKNSTKKKKNSSVAKKVSTIKSTKSSTSKRNASKTKHVDNKVTKKKTLPKTKKESSINEFKKSIAKIIKNINLKIKSTNKKFKTKVNKLKKDTNKKITNIKNTRFKEKLRKKEENSRRKEELVNKNKVIKEVLPKKEVNNKNKKEEIQQSKEGIDKTKTSNTTKLIIIIVLFILAVAITLLIVFKTKPKKQSLYTISLKEYTDLYNSESLQFVYITEKNCTYCNLLEPYVEKMQTDYDIEFKVLDITNLSNKELEYLRSTNIAFEEDVTAPMLISIKNGEAISNVNGYKEYSVLKKFVNNSKNPSDNNSFVKININKFLTLMKSPELTIIYIGRPNSSGCDAYNKVLESVSNEKNFTVHYLNTDTLDTEDEWDALESSNDIFKDTWFVPVTLIIKNGELVDYKMETMDTDTLLYFLNENGV